jgi:hypothetical protein
LTSQRGSTIASITEKTPSGPAARAAVNVTRLIPLLAQLAALLWALWYFNVQSPTFLRLAVVTYVGFLIHYFVPYHWKKHAFIAISLIGAVIVLKLPDARSTSLMVSYAVPVITVASVLLMAIYFFIIFRLPIPFWYRVGIVLVTGCLLMWARDGEWGLPTKYWAVLGAVFMFRLILYGYEVKVGREPERLIDCLSYFCLLPNFAFLLFPVIDYTTFKKAHYARNTHDNIQRGIAWMVRGATHLMLYRILYHSVVIGPHEVDSFWSMCRYIFPTYLLYLQISGQFHMIVGMLHLFGYSLPETNRYWLLASSFTDFWRRINIYWKDFMIKAFYYPVYFRLRKKNDTLALIIATIIVFVATTLLHSYQFFWLQGAFDLKSTDVIFWTVLGVVVLINVLWETKRGRRPKRSKGVEWTRRVLSIIGVYLTITILWSIWSSKSLSAWFETISYWNVG